MKLEVYVNKNKLIKSLMLIVFCYCNENFGIAIVMTTLALLSQWHAIQLWHCYCNDTRSFKTEKKIWYFATGIFPSWKITKFARVLSVRYLWDSFSVWPFTQQFFFKFFHSNFVHVNFSKRLVVYQRATF